MDRLEPIKNTAAEWVARRHGGQWSPGDEDAFDQWLNASMSHRVEYLCHEKTWRESNRLKVLGAGAQPGVIPTVEDLRASPYFKHARPLKALAGSLSQSRAAENVPERTGARPAWKSFAAAAGLLVICAGSYFSWNALRGDRYSTSIGVTTAVPLSDGSKVTLNTDSKIRVSVTRTERRIDLDQGEAFFDVAKDPLRPFIVVVGDKRVVAVGTRFSVRRMGEDLRVVVTEGKVMVSSLLLGAGDIAQTRHEQFTVQQRSSAQTEQILSWREGYLMFDEMKLADAVAEFNRYNAQKFVIQDATIADIPVTGHFRSTNVESFATLLERGFPVAVHRERERILLRLPE